MTEVQKSGRARRGDMRPAEILFARLIDARMAELKIGNAELARRVGVTGTTVGEWRGGRCNIALGWWPALFKVLGWPVGKYPPGFRLDVTADELQ